MGVKIVWVAWVAYLHGKCASMGGVLTWIGC